MSDVQIMDHVRTSLDETAQGPKPTQAERTEVVPAASLRVPESWLPELHTPLNRAEVERRLKEAFVLVEVDNARKMAPKMAEIVGWLAKLRAEHKPKYKEVAALLADGVTPDVGALKVTIQTNDARNEGVPTDRGIERHERPAPPRQNAIRYYFLAGIQCGIREKSEKPHPAAGVTINSVEYRNPVEALLAGETLTSVYHSWHNIVVPTEVDLTTERDQKHAAEAAYRQALDKKTTPTVVIRAFNDKKNGEVRKRIRAGDFPAVLKGTIMGLVAVGRDGYTNAEPSDAEAHKQVQWTESQVRRALLFMGWTAETLVEVSDDDDTETIN